MTRQWQFLVHGQPVEEPVDVPFHDTSSRPREEKKPARSGRPWSLETRIVVIAATAATAIELALAACSLIHGEIVQAAGLAVAAGICVALGRRGLKYP